MYVAGNVPADANDLPAFLSQELQNIEQARTDGADAIYLQTLYQAPSRLTEGMMVVADGTTWNPGSGAGCYMYRASAWRFLG